jgi:hypothetical protein
MATNLEIDDEQPHLLQEITFYLHVHEIQRLLLWCMTVTFFTFVSSLIPVQQLKFQELKQKLVVSKIIALLVYFNPETTHEYDY